MDNQPYYPMIYCPNCNTQIDADSVFCYNCGTQILGMQPDQAQPGFAPQPGYAPQPGFTPQPDPNAWQNQGGYAPMNYGPEGAETVYSTDNETCPPMPGPVNVLVQLQDCQTQYMYQAPMQMQQLTVGRAPDRVQLVITGDKSISRNQMTLFYRDGHMVAADNSTYGTFVNGQRMMCEVELNQNDVIKMGSSTFVIHWSIC